MDCMTGVWDTAEVDKQDAGFRVEQVHRGVPEKGTDPPELRGRI